MGSKSTQKTEVPAYIEEAGKLALESAKQVQEMGYIPYMGPEIAAISESERALNRNVGSMASAFGLQGPAPLSMGDAEVMTAGGVSGYSSYPAYMQAIQRLQEQRPDQYAYLAGMGRFDPITGAQTTPIQSAGATSAAGATGSPVASGSGGDNGPVFASDVAAAQEDFFRSTGNDVALANMNSTPNPNLPDIFGPSSGQSYSIDIGNASIPLKNPFSGLLGG